MASFLAGINEHFQKLENPLLRKTLAKVATIETAAKMARMELSTLLRKIADKISSETGQFVEVEDSSPKIGEDTPRLEKLKAIIRGLHAGMSLDEAKKLFAATFADVEPTEIASMEQQLVKEGLSEEEIKKLCDVHVAVFKDSLKETSGVTVPKGHPIDLLKKENSAILEYSAFVNQLIEELKSTVSENPTDGTRSQIATALIRLQEVDKHYLKKENQLFPVMEDKGITAPPKVMWAIHDDIRAQIKTIQNNLESLSVDSLVQNLSSLISAIQEMVYKEERILFPLCLETFSERDWARVFTGFETVGYAFIEPELEWTPKAQEEDTENLERKDHSLPLDTGLMKADTLNLLLKHLPVDISFVDQNDTVLYYNEGKERVFPRSPGVIGRKVQDCHPAKSVHVVNQILSAFRNGERDVAEFWIQSQGKFIHIRYFAVRDSLGLYRGCLEVVQDVTQIRAMQGERRLLEWS